MTDTLTLFYIFAAILVFAAFRVITARHPVHAALFLVLSFFTAAAIWLLLKAEFLAITLVLVYVGAVMVLFLFVVMMVDLDLDKLRQGFWQNAKVALPVGLLIVFEMGAILLRSFQVPESAVPLAKPISNTKALGQVLYTDYFFAFQIAAVILLLAMVAAIALTLRHRKDAKHQDPGQQVRVQAKDRLKMVQFPKASQSADSQTASSKGEGA